MSATETVNSNEARTIDEAAAHLPAHRGEAKPTGTPGLLMKVTEAGDVLSVSRSTVYTLINEGALETVHIGRSIRIVVASLEKFVYERRSGDSIT